MSEVPPNDPVDQNPPAGGGDDPKEKGTVAYETHQKLLSEKKREQAARQEAEAKLKKLEDEKAEREKAELTSQGKFKEALEKTEGELAKERAEKEALLGDLRTAQKRRAILSEIAGVVPERAQSLLPLDEIKIGDDGKPDQASVKAAAQKFEKEYSFAVQKDKAGGGLPPDAPQGGLEKKLTKAEWEKLPVAEMKKRHNEVDWTK